MANFHLYDTARIGKFIKTESRSEITKGRGEEEWGINAFWVESLCLGR